MADKTIVLVLTKGADKLEIGTGKIYGLLSHSGIEASDYTQSKQAYAQMDGSRLSGTHIEPRVIDFTAECTGVDDTLVLRSTILRFFDPKKAGTLRVTIGAITRTIAYRVEFFGFTQKNLWEPLRFRATLTCLSPYLKGDTYAANLAGVTPLMGFPLVLHSVYRPVLSYRTLAQEAPIYNTGDNPVGIRAIIIAKRGAVSNPSLSNLTTGESIRVVTEMAEGDRLIISTIPGQKTVTLNGVNIIQRIDRTSVFFQMQQGENIITYDADSGRALLDVYPQFTPEYLGV